MARINFAWVLMMMGCAASGCANATDEDESPNVTPKSEISIATVYSTACLTAPADLTVTMPLHPPYTNIGTWTSPLNWSGHPGCDAWTVDVAVPGRADFDHTPLWGLDVHTITLTPPWHSGFDLSDLAFRLDEKTCPATKYFFSLFRRRYNEIESTVTGQGTYRGKWHNGVCKLVPVGTPLVPPVHIPYAPEGKSDHYRVALALTTSSQRQAIAFQLVY